MATLAERYIEQLKQLLPPGKAYSRDPDEVIDAVLGAIADELVIVHNRAQDVIDESDPRTTDELVADYERVLDLPDCGDLGDTLQERQSDIASKLVSTGGQSRQYFIDVAKSAGFTVTIDEFRPFRVGSSSVGDGIADYSWWFTWRVNLSSTPKTYFRAGISKAGDRLVSTGQGVLECRISRLKPAHTVVLFAYTQSLDIDFTQPQHGSPDISYSRTGTKGFFGSDGDLAIAPEDHWPLEYNPDTLVAKGRSVWRERTNYFLNALSPATQTVDLSGESTGNYTVSVFGTGSATVSANTAVGTGFGVATEGSPVTFDMTTAGSVDVSISGDVDACQLENDDSGYPSPIIETAGSTATRGEEIVSVPDIGEWWDSEGSTIVIKGVAGAGRSSDWQTLLFLRGTGNDYIQVLRKNSVDGLDLSVQVNTDAGGSQANLSLGALLKDEEFNIAIRIEPDNIGASRDGGDASVDTAADIPSIDQIEIGMRQDVNGVSWDGIIKSLKIEPVARSDDELSDLSGS